MSNQAIFIEGSTMRHVVVMTSTASIGLMTLFVVDLADLFFLSLLGETELAAAIGYAGSILFFTTSISIGIAIATGALVSQSLGKKERVIAKRYAVNVMCYGIVSAFIISAVIWTNIPTLLQRLGAEGRSLELATDYLTIIIPSMVILVIAMTGNGILRATGDAKRSMYSTVSGGLVNAALDPLFIFTFSMGVKGAAWASVVSRVVVMLVALNGAIRVHDLVSQFCLKHFIQDLSKISKIAIPAMLTNSATPIGNAYVITAIAKYGDGAVAGMSIIGRITPVAFGIVFALSGAIGPIVGQNFGAGKIDRVRQTLRDAIIFSSVTVLIVAILLYCLQGYIILGFQAGHEAAQIIIVFTTWVAATFAFNAYLFISNAVFNNLGFPHYSTVFNFAKATIGTIPFVYIGSVLANASGVLIGQAVGTILTGIVALWLCHKTINRCDSSTGPIYGPKKKPFNMRIPLWPQTNTRG